MVNHDELREMMQRRVEEILLAVERERSREEEAKNREIAMRFWNKKTSKVS
ncbi:MAG: hypothetical protein O9346_12000 [Leptospiraceae bacterium]|nr:hypothetical protein [Leptospiraceae bacterium]MCZ8347131.1 hypothetical protein [Leptospiraceae bacterium]